MVDPADDPKRLIDLTEAAERLAVSKSTLRRWTKAGLVPCVRLQTLYRYKLGVIEKIREEGLPLD